MLTSTLPMMYFNLPFTTAALDEDAKAGSTPVNSLYSATKFIQLLGAHWWHRQLQGKCQVVAVSPGMIPGTNLARHASQTIPANHPDAKTIAEGQFPLLEKYRIAENLRN